MGLAQGGGTQLGNAVGTISINTQGVSAAASTVQSASASMTKSLGGIGPAAAQAQSGVSGLATTLKGLAGAAGFSVGIAGAVLLGKKLIDMGADSVKASSDLSESINKIDVAFGSSGRTVLAWSKNSATALGQSQQQALEAASGFGLMFGTMQIGEKQAAQMSESLVQLATDMASINNVSPEEALIKLKAGLVGEAEPLRSMGVLLDEATVKAKAMAMGLAPSEAALTQQDKVLARYQLILEQTSKTQGDFARTQGGLANQMRTLEGHVGDLSAAFGKNLAPAVLTVVGAMNDLFAIGEKLSNQGPLIELPAWMTANPVGNFLKNNHFTGDITGANSPYPFFAPNRPGDERSQMAAQQSASVRAGRASPDTRGSQIHLDWARGIEDLNRDTHDAIIDEEESFGQSRAKTVADYNKSVARDEAAYARGRLREQMDFLDALADVGKDATRRESGMASDLARTQGQARSDSAEREVDIKDDANKRLVKLDEDYEKDRLKRAKDLSDNLLDAAGDLDAKQVYQLQRDAAKQQQQASDAHDDARKEIGDGLQERLDDEAKSLDKSLRQQQESYDLQIEQGRESDRIRLQDMKDAFTKSQAREAEDHQTQVDERAADQAAQLTEMDTQHGLRIAQIGRHAQDERDALQKAADDALIAEELAGAALVKRHEAEEKAREDLWDKFHKHIVDSLTPGAPGTPGIAATPGSPRGYASGGYVPRTGMALVHQGEYVIPARTVSAGMSGGSSRSVVIQSGAVQVYGAANQPIDQLADLVVTKMIKEMEAHEGV